MHETARVQRKDLDDNQILEERREVTAGELRRTVLHESDAPGVQRRPPAPNPSAAAS